MQVKAALSTMQTARMTASAFVSLALTAPAARRYRQNVPSTAVQESNSSQRSTGFRPLPSMSMPCRGVKKCAAVLNTNLAAKMHSRNRTARSARVILR